MDFNLSLKYENGIDCGGTITNYKPPVPVSLRKGNQSLHGHTIFQDPIDSDTLIAFSIAFETHTEEQIKTFKLFRSKFSERFIFLDEFKTEYRGYLQGKIGINTPIEGDIYYMSLEMLCPCGIEGWKGDNIGL